MRTIKQVDNEKTIAKNMVAEQFKTLRCMPMFEMENGSVLYIQYNKETDHIDVGTGTNIGIHVEHSFEYDHDFDLDTNLQDVYDQLSDMPEYQ